MSLDGWGEVTVATRSIVRGVLHAYEEDCRHLIRGHGGTSSAVDLAFTRVQWA